MGQTLKNVYHYQQDRTFAETDIALFFSSCSSSGSIQRPLHKTRKLILQTTRLTTLTRTGRNIQTRQRTASTFGQQHSAINIRLHTETVDGSELMATQATVAPPSVTEQNSRNSSNSSIDADDACVLVDSAECWRAFQRRRRARMPVHMQREGCASSTDGGGHCTSRPAGRQRPRAIVGVPVSRRARHNTYWRRLSSARGAGHCLAHVTGALSTAAGCTHTHARTHARAHTHACPAAICQWSMPCRPANAVAASAALFSIRSTSPITTAAWSVDDAHGRRLSTRR